MDISHSKEHCHDGNQAVVEANKLRSNMKEKAKEAGPSGSRGTKEIMGSEMQDVSNDVLANLPGRSGDFCIELAQYCKILILQFSSHTTNTAESQAA